MSYLALITPIAPADAPDRPTPAPTPPGYWGPPQMPPGIWPSPPGGGQPPYPSQGPGFPTHPIAPGGQPPYPSQGPGFPTHPIAPGGPPLGIWGGPWLPPYPSQGPGFPTHPIAPGGGGGWGPGPGHGPPVYPSQGLPVYPSQGPILPELPVDPENPWVPPDLTKPTPPGQGGPPPDGGGNWVWAYVPGQGWQLVRLPGKGEAGPKSA